MDKPEKTIEDKPKNTYDEIRNIDLETISKKYPNARGYLFDIGNKKDNLILPIENLGETIDKDDDTSAMIFVLFMYWFHNRREHIEQKDIGKMYDEYRENVCIKTNKLKQTFELIESILIGHAMNTGIYRVHSISKDQLKKEHKENKDKNKLLRDKLKSKLNISDEQINEVLNDE